MQRLEIEVGSVIIRNYFKLLVTERKWRGGRSGFAFFVGRMRKNYRAAEVACFFLCQAGYMML